MIAVKVIIGEFLGFVTLNSFNNLLTAFFSSGFIYVNYLKTPLFLSKTKIIPISTQPQSQGVGAIAQRFGVSLVSPAKTGSLSSAEIFPDILRSRSLMRELLYKEFETNECKRNNIFHRKEDN